MHLKCEDSSCERAYPGIHMASGVLEHLDVEKGHATWLRLTTVPNKQMGTVLLNGIATWAAFFHFRSLQMVCTHTGYYLSSQSLASIQLVR